MLGEWTPPWVTYVPPGWNGWDVVGNGYIQYNYLLNHNHHVIKHGTLGTDYLNSVLQHYGTQFITDTAAQQRPFFLEIASFSPHTPSTPAPADVGTFAGITVPQGPAFDRLPTDPPSWLASHTPLSILDMARLDGRDSGNGSSRSKSVDRMIGTLEQTLKATGQLKNTMFVFSSDNGYHMGQHGLRAGKLTAFESDVRVPLIVAGPGIAAGSTNDDIVQNVDLAPTFEQLAGATPPPSVEGRSLVPLLAGEHPPWRSLALIEHVRPPNTSDDPDKQSYGAGNPPTYQALRSARFTYVRYVNGDREYYDRTRDPAELNNLAPSLTAARIAQLNRWLNALQTRANGAQCWDAGRPRGDA